MDSEKVEKHLRELRNQINVDQKLKKQLRETFVKKKKNGIWKNPLINVLLAAVIFIAMFFSNFQMQQTNASSLKISNSISFFDVGSGQITAYTHHKGNLYISIKNKGIYIYNNSGYKKVTDDVAASISHSSIDDYLLISDNENIFRLNIMTKKKEKIVTGSPNYSYIYPDWKNQHSIYATKKTNNQQTIVEINLETKEEKVITTGSMPSFIEKERKLIFERNGKVMIKDTRDGNEKIVDTGKDPSISKDGAYISYIKENAGFEDVWITDLDLETKKKVTTNTPSMENPKKGLYDYLSPIWSSNDHKLFVLKKREQERIPQLKIMKISLSDVDLTPTVTVERYLQALIVRDDDYAKSMMKHPPEFLTYSNPHHVGFRLLSTKENKKSAIVRAEVYWTYTANPYYKISTYEFELFKDKDRYMIKNVQERSTKEISAIDTMGLITTHVQILDGGEKENLFSLQDIPKSIIRTENTRISSLVMDNNGKTVIFTLQEMKNKTGRFGVTLLKFDIDSKTFSLLAHIEPDHDGNDIVMEQLSLDATGQYLAVDLFSDPKYPDLFVFDLNKGKQIEQFKKTHSVYWQGEQLMMQVFDENQFMLYQFDPKLAVKKIL